MRLEFAKMASSGLDGFCGDKFWDASLTWHTNDPEFTRCFERTVLVWIPCIYLWVFSSLEVFYILNSKKRNIPWNFLNISKLALNCALIALNISDFAVAISRVVRQEEVFNVDIYTPLIRILTFSLAAALLIYNRKNGLVTSGLLFQFWLLCGIFGIPQFRTEIREAQLSTPDPYYDYISYIIYYPVVLLILFLNCFADKSPLESKYPKSDNPCPELQSSFLSKIIYSWFDRLAWKGYRNPLETKDLWELNPEDSANEVVQAYDKHWQKIVKKCQGTQAGQQRNATYKTDAASVDFVDGASKKQASILPALIKTFGPMFLFGAFLKLIQDLLTFASPQILRALISFVENKEEQWKGFFSILPALIKTFGPMFLFGAFLKLIQDLLTFASPQILRALISFVENKEEQWKGFFYAGLLFLTASIQTLVLAQYFQRMFIVGMRIRTALISTIYRKALRMSNTAKKESTVGEIVNLMSVDAQKFIELTAYLNMIWSAPLQIILALYFLWDILGPSVLAGLAVMIIMIPINGFIANKVKVLQIKQMKNKDERVKLMNEVLSGIKVLKLYAWEPSFESQVLKIRGKEMKVLKKAAYLNAGTSFIWSCAPFLVRSFCVNILGMICFRKL